MSHTCTWCSKPLGLRHREVLQRVVSGFLTTDQVAELALVLEAELGRPAQLEDLCPADLTHLMAAAV